MTDEKAPSDNEIVGSICVKLVSGKTYNIPFAESDEIYDIKIRVAQQDADLHPLFQKYIGDDGLEIDNAPTCKELGIKDGHVISAIQTKLAIKLAPSIENRKIEVEKTKTKINGMEEELKEFTKNYKVASSKLEEFAEKLSRSIKQFGHIKNPSFMKSVSARMEEVLNPTIFTNLYKDMLDNVYGIWQSKEKVEKTQEVLNTLTVSKDIKESLQSVMNEQIQNRLKLHDQIAKITYDMPAPGAGNYDKIYRELQLLERKRKASKKIAGTVKELMRKLMPISNRELKTIQKSLIENSSNGELDQVRELVITGLDVNSGMDSGGNTAFMLASCKKHPEVVKLLLAADADVDSCKCDNTTCLMEVAGQGDLNLCRLFVALGADVFARNDYGENALGMFEAFENNNPELAAFLKEQMQKK